MPAAVLLIDINARLAKLEESVSRIPGVFGTAGKKVEAQLSGINTQLLAFGRTAIGAFGIPLGGAALVGFLKDVGERVAEEERGFARLNATLRATQNASGLTAGRLGSIADELKGSTVFDDDEIRQAEVALLRFRTVQQGVFEEAIRLAPDVASALGTDLVSAATALGRALTDPESGMKALKAAGVNLSEQQKDLAARFIEAGDKASAQRIVLDELRKSVGGTAGAENTGIYGASKNLSKAWDDLLKSLGRQVAGSATAGINLLAEGVSKFAAITEKAANHYERLLLLTGGAASIATGGAIGLPAGRLFGPGDASARTATGKIGGLPEQPSAEQLAAEAGARDERVRQREEQAYLDQEAALKRRAESAAQFYLTEFLVQSKALDRETAALEAFYDRNEISASDYYDRLEALALKSFSAQGNYLAKQVEAQQEYLSSSTKLDRAGRLGVGDRIQGLSDQANSAILDRDAKLEAFGRARRKAYDALETESAGINAQLLQISDHVHEAAAAFFDLSHKADREKFAAAALSSNADEARAGAEGLANLQALRRFTLGRDDLNEATKDYQRTLDGLGNMLERIGIAEQTGSMTELEALRAKSDANAAYVEALRERLSVLEAIARESGNKEDLRAIEQFRVQLAAIAATGDLVAKKFNDIGSSSLSQLLQDLGHGVKPLDALKTFGQTVNDRVLQVASDTLSQKAFGKDGPLSGFGDFLSSLFGGPQQSGALALNGSAAALTSAAGALTAAAGAISASSGASTVVSGSLASLGGKFDFGQFLTLFGQTLGFRAEGGPVEAGRAYVVGERGPEFFVPRARGRIEPARAVRREAPSAPSRIVTSSPSNVTINQTIQVQGQVDSRTARQLVREAGMRLSSLNRG